MEETSKSSLHLQFEFCRKPLNTAVEMVVLLVVAKVSVRVCSSLVPVPSLLTPHNNPDPNGLLAASQTSNSILAAMADEKQWN